MEAAELFWPKVDKSGDCWLWIGPKTTGGYGQFWDTKNNVRAHRWAFEDANGYLPPVVRHKCDTPLCVNPAHLEPGTQADNVRDREERGRGNQPKGSDHGSASLTEDHVHYIRANKLLSQREMAHLFGVTQTAVAFAASGRTWKHIKPRS